ncbi:pyridoxamine 5'-phosphate oxidase family protein [Leifsonia sp. NPDC058248]|uniref:pyridoxamine 5'-phosphate oxidase family protein n=1 Tax=Leifsonia sp. NPDC058248 TaxID=3346402 RepID=UPI0036D767F0
MPPDEVVRDLDTNECWQRLAETSVGRLATEVGGDVDIFPVNFYADGSTILIRTAPGTKLLALTVHDRVAFEVDANSADNAWSVVVKGRARQLESQAEIDEADRVPLTPWIPTLKYRYVRIEPTTISGRTFMRLPEPDRY